ncbi:MAG: class I SAM-dependent methyltransferase [Deltaproteobacteria bacterium]|nr:class I SAM-dependent methyltransferase [Deltaproteobacteria bacterium]
MPDSPAQKLRSWAAPLARAAGRLFRSRGQGDQEEIVWFLDLATFFRGTWHLAGWAFSRGPAIQALEFHLGDKEPAARLEAFDPSPDVAQQHGPAAAKCRFRLAGRLADGPRYGAWWMVVHLADGRCLTVEGLQNNLAGDPYHLLVNRFFHETLPSLGSGRVLEVGSRARSGVSRRDLIPPELEYVGMDIAPGENVDVVGDAHELSAAFPAGHFAAIFSMSVFEHLLMPWKVVLEMNRILAPGGLVMITTHHTFPLHDQPWDFWRYSGDAWQALFNSATGFQIVDTALGEPAAIVPVFSHALLNGLDQQPAFLANTVLARKTGESQLSWPVKLAEVVDSRYPA